MAYLWQRAIVIDTYRGEQNTFRAIWLNTPS